MNQLWIEV